MEGSKLQAFRQQVASPDGDQASQTRSSDRLLVGLGGREVQVVNGPGGRFGLLQPGPNQAARRAFAEALRESYGADIAERVFSASERDSRAPLTPDLARQVMENAAVMHRVDPLLEGVLAVRVPSLAAQRSGHSHASVSFYGTADAAGGDTRQGPVRDAKHAPVQDKVIKLSMHEVGEFGHGKFLARVGMEARRTHDEAALARADTKAETKSMPPADTRSTSALLSAGDLGAANLSRQGDATRALANYEKSGALEVDRAAQAILDGAREGKPGSVKIERAVARALEQMKTPQKARSAIYRDFVRNGLLVMAERVMKADPREGCPLLTQLASRMAEDMDGIVGRAIAGQDRFIGKRHDEVMASLASHPQRTFSELPRLLTGLDTQMVSFQRTMNDLLSRVEKDSASVSETLLSGRVAGPLIDIHVTGSDPHHGGQRVMILKFAGAPDTPVVYKPRDCRIDASIVGKARPGDVTMSAGALLNQALGAQGEIGTYQYLLRDDSAGAYAFIECIEHQDQLPEGQNTIEGVEKFFRGVGQFLALAYTRGIGDLHQGNGMVGKNGRMMFTDLEIAFVRDVLGDGSAPPSVAGTMMDKLLGKFEENDYLSPLAIDAAGRIQQLNNRTQTNPTRNFIWFEGRQMSPSDSQYGERIRAALKNGFSEAMAAMAMPGVNDQMVSALSQLATDAVHVRYHVAPTISQLDQLEIYRFDAHKLPEIAPGQLRLLDMDRQVAAITPRDGLPVGASQQATWNSVEGFLRQDFQDGDVAFFTRILGKADEVFHHDRFGPQAVDDQGKHLAYDGLGRSRDLIRSLRRPALATESPAETKATVEAETTSQVLETGSVRPDFDALPEPVKVSFDRFMDRVSAAPPPMRGRGGSLS